MDLPKISHIPPTTAIHGQACYRCFKANLRLRKCSNCRTVQYCSTVCQQTDWTEHKGICRALNSLETDEGTSRLLFMASIDEPVADPSELNAAIDFATSLQIRYIAKALNRVLTTPERNLLGWEPRCMACGRSERIIRMEPRKQGQVLETLKACQTCKMSFFCSTHLLDSVVQKHIGEACGDGHDGLTQCQMNQDIHRDIALSVVSADAKTNGFQWAPQRDLPAWRSLQNTNWETEFVFDLSKSIPPSTGALGTFLRAASEPLSFPMTILLALEHLNNDLNWTHAETLIIHVLGATEVEMMRASMFEEILHRLPGVNNLKLVFCGPDIDKICATGGRSVEMAMDTCPNCQRRGRQRVQELVPQTYHDFAAALGSTFVRPHLAIAFNSGSSQEDVESWKETMTFLVNHKIPSVFTSYNREEAEAEAQLLAEEAGATLIPALGPVKNKWGSLLAKVEPNKVIGFYAVNGWLAGGFR